MKLPKILSEKERLEKEKKQKRMMTIFIIFVLMASTAAFAFMSEKGTERIKYNGFSFIQTENGWQLKNTGLLTKFIPNDVENISSPSISKEDFKRNIYFIAITNAEQTAANELNSAFYSIIEKSHLACPEKYENESFCIDLPIKNCENESSNLVIQIEEDENQSISYSNNCLIIKGNEIDLLKSADRIIFSAYEIIK